MTETKLPAKELQKNVPYGFRIHDVCYYPAVKKEYLPPLLNHGYRYLFLDMGSVAEADTAEFLRCDKKLIIGSLEPWKVDNYRKFLQSMQHIINPGEGFYYLTRTESPKRMQEFSKAYHIKMRSIPYLSNPFCIEKEYFSTLEELLK